MGSRAKEGLGRVLTAPLLLFSLASTIIFLGIAAWEMITAITNFNDYFLHKGPLGAVFQAFDGNAATPFLIFMSMLAGCVVIASYLAGFYHVISWTTASASAALGAAWIAFGLLWTAFVMAWLQVHLGGHIGQKSQVTAAFVIITTILHVAYLTTLTIL